MVNRLITIGNEFDATVAPPAVKKSKVNFPCLTPQSPPALAFKAAYLGLTRDGKMMYILGLLPGH